MEVEYVLLPYLLLELVGKHNNILCFPDELVERLTVVLTFILSPFPSVLSNWLINFRTV